MNTRVVETTTILCQWPRRLVSRSFPGFFLILENRKSQKYIVLEGYWSKGASSGPWVHQTAAIRSESWKGEIWGNLKENQCRSAKIENPKSCRKCREYLRGHLRTGPGASEAMLGSLERLIHFILPNTSRVGHSRPLWREYRDCGFGLEWNLRRPALPQRNHTWLGDVPPPVFGGPLQGPWTGISRSETIQVPSAQLIY